MKKRDLQLNKSFIVKTGTFIPDKNNLRIRNLLSIAKDKDKVFEFIKNSNAAQKQITSNKNLHLINAKEFSSIAADLHLFASRLCIRDTFELNGFESTKITIETNPVFYAFPITRHVHKEQTQIDITCGHLVEEAKRVKLEIKSGNKDIVRNIENKLSKSIHKLRIPKDKYSKEPYYKMIIRVSEQNGTLVNEAKGFEIEAKADISNKADLKNEINNIRNTLFRDKFTPYKIFMTEPYVTKRGDEEKSRTIYGFKQNGSWTEVATLIRLTQKGKSIYGFSAILKWKDNPLSNKIVMKRKNKLEYLKRIPNEKVLINKLKNKIHKNIEPVGTCKKTKYRIYVQDKGGRNFCVSLDNVFVSKNKQLQQLEVEYVHTVILDSQLAKIPLKEACDRCLTYFIEVLKKHNVTARKSKTRKIDFLSDQT